MAEVFPEGLSPEWLAEMEGRAERWRGASPSSDPRHLLASDVCELLADLAEEKRRCSRAEGQNADMKAREIGWMAELGELKAEISALHGKPEGALPGWEWVSGVHDWRRLLDNGWVLTVHLDGTWSLRPRTVEAMDHPGAAELWLEHEAETSLRVAMRAADVEARRRGWLL